MQLPGSISRYSTVVMLLLPLRSPTHIVGGRRFDVEVQPPHSHPIETAQSPPGQTGLSWGTLGRSNERVLLRRHANEH